MSFQFPPNPHDGQFVTHMSDEGVLMTATFHAAKDSWVITRAQPSQTHISGITVTPTADRQVPTWDAHSHGWIAAKPEPPKLTELKDVVQSVQPHLGEAPLWTFAMHGEAQAKFQWGTPNAHIKTWDATRHWESGACAYHEGRLWRATQDNTNVEPVMDEGKATLYFYIKGEPTFGIVPMQVGYTAPPAGIQPVAFNFRYWYAIEYRGDNDATIWKMELKGKDPNGHIVGEWTGKPWPVLTWKNIIPPPKAPPGFVYLWIYTTPGVNHIPVIGQQTWAPLEFGSYLGAADDVNAPNPHANDILMFDATHHKWTSVSLADLKAKLDALGPTPLAPSGGAAPAPAPDAGATPHPHT